MERKIDFNKAGHEDEMALTVVDMFRKQAALFPDYPAVAYLDRSYTYAQVDEMTDRIAGYLKARGIGREDIVSVLIPRCEYMVIASLGVLKAGAAYQPLDPTYPKERIGFMMQDASAKLLIAEESLLDLADSYGGEVLLTKDIPSLPAESSMEAAPAPEDLFVLLYTSGSTGVPKGVMLEHRNVAALCHWYHEVYRLAPGENVALYPSYGFDAHMMDLYPAITGGACVHIIDESIRLDLLALNDYFEKNHIIHVTMTTQVGRQFVAEVENHSLRALSVGGEKLVPVEPPKNYDFYNEYGPTECTIIITQYLVDKLYDKVPVGKAVNNLKLYVVDKRGRKLPPGVPGELWVAGPQVGRGYLNRPEETAKAFLKNPFSSEPGYERVYRTGDIVRLMRDGNVDFIGRNDGMVKIRGFRIELPEVEHVIRQYPGIKDATVADFEEAGGGRFLAAYVVSDETVDIQKLNEFIKARKPPYMVPAVTMQIDRIPLTQNQKVDRKALPVPQKKVQEIVAPQNEVQQKIFDCMAEVIGSREFGITTDIYEAGVTSIGAIRLNVLLSKAFDVVIRNQDLKENNTIEKLEQFVAGAEKAVAYEVYPDYPLTQTQKGIFVDSMANAGTTIYNIPSLFRLSEKVDLLQLQRAVEQAVNAHPYVKATLFLDEQGEVRAARNDGAEPVVELVACDKLPGNEELVRPYELLGERLYRAQVYQTDEGSYLFLDFHHIISDGVSTGIMVDDINRAYAGEKLAAESYTGFEAALDEGKLRQTAAYDKAKAYYDSVFDGCETDYLPVKDRVLAVQSVDNINYESSLPVAEIEKFCADHELTLNAFFNGVFGYVLAKYNNKEESLYTTVYNGRNDSRLARSVTMLVKTLPVHCSAAGERKIIDLLTETRDQLVESMANDIYSFAEIAREYEIKPDILFVYQGDEFGDSIIAGEKAQLCDVKLDTAKAPININVFIRNNKFVFACEYRSDMYQEETMQGMLLSLSIASGEFLQKNCLKDISLLNEELANKLAAFNRTETAYDKSSVVEQFRQQAALYPNHQAVVYLDRSYTYAQVDELTDRIAGYLQAKGIGREDVVSVLIPRCEYMVLASLGVLKAGAAYQPLDPTYPKERIGFMMEDASAKLLIAEEGLLDLAEGYAGEVLLTKDIPELPACGSIPAAPAPEDLFVLLYTSGSTGVPKGVMLEHGNLAAFCSWYNDVHAFAPGEHVALYPSYGFDAHMIDFYPAIIRGACVHIIDESIRLDLVLLNDYFEKNNIVHAFMTTQIGRQFMTEMENHSLRALSVGGEKLVPVEPPQNYDVYNVYGPTECTIITTQYMVDKLYYKVPVGKAVNNLKLYVVDKAGKILPPGMPGELWVAGPQVGRGYLKRPELTAKVFIRNPFSNEAGYDRVYRTGDIVRFLPDGTVDFIGRNDGMVKIRGFRIELSEVERVIRQYPGIKDATVADFAAAGGGRFLAAYVVSDETVDIQQLNEFIQERKPPYMVPAVTMQIDRIPLNQNQKVNRKALPVPQKKVQEIVAPQNEVQQKIFDCMAEVIGSREFGITTDIYEAGVTSIGAIRLNVLLSKAFDVVIRNQDLKENNTIEKLEQFVAGAERAVAYEVYPDYPLTQTQKGIFVDSMANAGTTIYNIPSLFRLSDMVELPRLKAAVEQAIDAHPYVKTTLFLDEQGEVRAARNDSDEPVVELIVCEQLPGNEELVLPYELLGGRLYRAQVYQTGGGSYLFLDFHHIISDGTSMSIIMEDINRAYDGEELTAESYTGFEAALDEAKLRQTAAYDKAKAYYDSVFAGCETDYLPMNDRELAVQSVDNISYESSLTVAEIEKFCADHELTLNAFFNGVFGYVLARYNNKEDALFTTIYNGRNDSRLAKTVTMLVKTLPVHCSAAGDRKITDLLTETRDQLMESMANDIYSFAEIAREYEIKPDILFVYQGDEFGDSIIAGEKAQPCDVKLDTAKAPISINVFIRNNKFVFACEYRSDLYQADTMQGILQSLSIASGEFLQKNCLKDISLLNEELASKLDAFNQTKAAYDKSSVVEQFRQQAALYPNNKAVVYLDRSYTYAQVDELTDRIAGYLKAKGIGKEDVVSVLIPRCEYMVLASLGVLKAGAAYQPLDPTYPKERIGFMMEDASAKLLIAEEGLLDLAEGYAGEVLLTKDIPELPVCESIPVAPAPEDLFVLLYTSGSTGVPKGVMLEHRNVAALCYWYHDVYQLAPGENVALYPSYGFDAHMMDLYPGITRGACVHIIDESIRLDLLALNDYFEKNHIIHVTMTTQVGRQFVAEVENHSLRALSVGGEKLVPVEPPKNYDFYNEYGPTECTIITTQYLVDKLYDKVPIGRAVNNLKLYVVDKDGKRLPPGMPGELWVAGPQVGRGYLNRPEQTDKVFISNPFSQAEGYDRVYRTGDIVRLLPDGTVDFIGRNDGMVKIRGFRIELSEVERVIRQYPGIKDATVADFAAAGGGRFLAAYVVSEDAVDVDKLNDFILERKPPYMVPAVTMQIDRIPLTQNQKVDRKALPVPQKKVQEIVAPQNEVQQRIFDCLAEVIGSREFGITTDIYEAGVTSIGAIRLNVLLSKAFDVVIRNQDLKENNTIEKLERFVAGAERAVAYEVYPDYPLTQTQKGIFVDSMSNAGTTIYNIPSLFKLSEKVDLLQLQRAVEQAVNAHPYVKATLFLDEQGEVRAARNDSAEPVVELVACDKLPGDEELVRPYELLGGRLYRAQIYQTGEGSYLFLDFHHIASDGTSMSIMMEDINRAYDGEALTAEGYTGFEAALDEVKLRQTAAYDKAKAYYDSVFAGCETDYMPVKDRVLAVQSVDNINYESNLSVAELEKFCADHELTLNAFFNGVFGYVLAKYNNKEESLYTTVYNGRNDSRLARSVTMLVKTLPVHCSAAGERKIIDLLTETRDQLVESMANDIYSFAEIAREYEIKPDILFVYQGDKSGDSIIAGEKAQLCDVKLNTAKAPININVFIRNNKFVFACEYRSDLYRADTMQGILQSLSIASGEFLQKNCLKDISLLNEELANKLAAFNRTETAYDKSSVVEQFRQQAALYPNHQAVVYLDRSYTYAQVDELTDRIAGYLQAKGIGREDVVSVLIPRCEYMVLASLGVLKAGAAYQPLDPTYPKERIGFMMEDASAKLLIAEEGLLDLAEGYAGEVLLTKDIPELPACGSIPAAPAPEDLFVLLYTSGSTGVPKGVMLEHGNLAAFCSWYNDVHAFAPGEHVALYPSYGFDAHMIDFYPAIIRGACVHIIDESIRLDLVLLNDYFEKNNIVHAFMTTQIGRQFMTEMENHSLRALSVGGEKLVPVEPPQNYDVYNVYGPTECTIITTQYLVDKLYYKVPVGKAVNNLKLYVVDKAGKILPPGMPGELWVAGPQVGRGYLKRPELTAKVFIRNPFSNEAGYDRVYRTGDIVRFLPDGTVDFIGRNDGMVKIRGFRIELSEVERVIRQYPGIKDATVADFAAAGGGRFLAAYVVSEDAVDVDKLNDFILERKPPYMVPAVTMQIDRIPLNQNQKVNRKALPVPQKKVQEIVAPQNEVQQRIFDCIAEVIGSREFGITTDIYEAGVTSIGAIRLNVLLSKAFDVVIRNQDLKENNTIEKLEQFVAGAERAVAYEVYPDYPLTQTQNGIFVESVANAGTTVYNIPYLFKLGDKVDIQRLQNAVEQAIDAHQYVKTTLFLNEQGDVRAARNDSAEPVVELIACEHLPGNEELVLPYELLGNNLYRARIYQTDAGNYLFLDFHHIISDGTSEGIFIRDINRAYAGESLVAESYSGFEIAMDEERLRQTDAYTKAKQYYDAIFEGVDGNFLPPRDSNASAEVPGEASFVSELSVEAVKAYCQKHDITLNAFFNGVFAVVLSKYNYRDEAVYTTIYNGRSDARLENSVSMLVKTLPVYCRTEGSLRIADMLTTMKNHLVDSMANDLYSFGEIARAYNLPADILFAYQGESFAFDNIAGEKAELCSISLNAVKAPLSIDVVIHDGKVAITAEYQNDRYARETITGMLACMNKVMTEFLCKTYIKDVSLLCDAAHEQMEGFNDTDYPVEAVPVHKLFERQAELHAEETAIIADGRKLTYKELNSRANQLAKLLVQGGLALGEAVGLVLPRIVDVPVAEYGIMKAGGAFLPMLPDYPDDRMAYCLKDSGSRFVVTTRAIQAGKQELFAKAGCTVLTVEDLAACGQAENLNLEIPADSLAYVIYTSGSTGTPKGVMIEHRNLCNFVDANPKNHETVNFVSYGRTALSVAAISFDFSLMEIHIPLCNGMTVCMASGEEIYNPLSLLRLIKEHHVDVISGTPSFISNFIDAPEAKVLAQVKMYDFGAEAFPETLYEKLHRLSPEAVIVNGYGPTEATISCISKVIEGNGKVTIGTPAANVRAYICDLDGNILPAGARGELVICGAGVGRGYVNLPEKTKDVFITLNGRRAYRSGDMARYNQAGELEFFGRLDNQVKLRGLRVELDEISSVMSTYPSVTHAVVVVRGEGQQQFLCGYYVAEDAIAKADLTEHMKKSLAPYMVPSVLMQLKSMPLTANGKINKRALPEPEASTDEREYAAPVNELQSKLAGMFAKALGVEKVGITEDFFALGGTSLTASKVAMQAMLEKLPVAYADIFDNPTVEKLSRFILAKQGQEVQAATAAAPAEEAATEATGVARALAHNTNKYVDEVAAGELGNVLLTGATGFLGIHVLKVLLEKTANTVYCLIRRGKSASVEKRLKGMFFYYFSESMDELMGSRVQVIEGDITEAECIEGLAQYDFKTVINCAACVKHFVNDDILDRINVHGVENLVEFCSKTGRRLVQISTVSVAGDNINDKFPEEKTIHENELFFGQSLGNKYIYTKFMAEKAVLEAVADGRLDGKIIRVGNLMSRHSDGEFQINFVTNGFMRTLRGYAAIGKFPVSGMDESAEFSPIDCTAEAIVQLSGVNSQFTVFHACNSHRVQMGDVIEVMNHCGLKVDVVAEAEFEKSLTAALADEQQNMLVSGLISYMSSDSQNNIRYIDYDNVFTIKALYRLGYKWPITDDKYLENAFMALKTLGFFDAE